MIHIGNIHAYIDVSNLRMRALNMGFALSELDQKEVR